MKLKLGPLPEIVWEALTSRTVFDPVSSHKGLWSAPDLESLWIQPKSYTHQHLHGLGDWVWVFASFPLLLGRRIKIIATQRLPEMPSLLSLYISTFHLFHKAFTNIGFFQWRVSEASKEVMSLKDLNGDQREVSNISCCIGLGDHWDHTWNHPFMHSHSFILSFNISLWNANCKCQSARSWTYDSDQGIWGLCFHKTDSLGGETDIKLILCISGDVNPARCSAGEELVALRVFESESEVAQSCLTLCNPMDSSLPGSSVHGIFQAIVLEWIAISFSRGSSQTRDWTRVSRIVDRHFTVWATREVLRVFSRGFILARASWKDVTGLSEWLDRDEWLKCKGSDSGHPGAVGKGQMVQGLTGCRRSLLLIPRAVGSLMELQIWIRYGKRPRSTVGEKDTQTII